MNDLEQARKEINEIDKEMALLFERRMAAAEKIAVGIEEIVPLCQCPIDIMPGRRIKAIIIPCIEHGSGRHLLQLIDAAGILRLVTGFVQSRKQHGSEDRNDGDHNQKFDQGKLAFHLFFLSLKQFGESIAPKKEKGKRF